MPIIEPTNTDIVRLQTVVGADGLTLSVGPGRCFLPGARRIATDGTATISLSSPSASTWYHAYAYEVSSGVLGVELSATGYSGPYPSANGSARTKVGDTSRRYLGSFYVDSTGKIRPMRHTQCGSIGNLVTFDAAVGAASLPVALVSLFTSSTASTVSLNPIVPATASHAIIQVQNNSNRQVYIANPEQGAASPTNYVASVNPGASDSMLIGLSTSQQLSVLLSSTSLLGAIIGAVLTGSVNIVVLGYLYDR